MVKNNSKKQSELLHLQKCVIDKSQVFFNESLEQDRRNQQQLDALKQRKNELDTEIKQCSEINEKLSHLVAIVQQSDEEEEDCCSSDEVYFTISETLEDYERMKLDYATLVDKLNQMDMNVKQNESEIKSIIDHNQELMVDVQRNDNILRLLEQQNKYAEQQFDLILNKLPWEPLTGQYIKDLRKSNKQAIRDLADTLELQTNEIQELNESLSYKKKEKLEVLEQLLGELNLFVQKRDEAILITRFIEREN